MGIEQFFQKNLFYPLTNENAYGIIIRRHHGTAMMREVAVETIRVFPRSMSGSARHIRAALFFAIGRLVFSFGLSHQRLFCGFQKGSVPVRA